jgi:hypothetical protein
MIKPLNGIPFYSQVAFYASNFVMFLQHIFPNTNSEEQERVDVEQ